MVKTSYRMLLSWCALTLASCGPVAHYSPVKPHHTPEGFRNLFPHAPKGSFWKWQWDRWLHGVPDDPAGGYGFPARQPDIGFLKSNRSAPTLTWLGHATFLVQLGGSNILTDPHLTARASPLSFAGPKRHMAPALELDELPHIDIVVVSHSHYDHLDAPTLKQLAKQPGGPPRFFVGLGLREWAEEEGIPNVAELDWGDSAEVSGVNLHFVPVQHWSQRSLRDRNRTLWGAWVIEHGGRRVFFGGDFGYSPDLAAAGERFGGFDLALIPIGAYEPRWFMKTYHVNPQEAVQAHIDLQARFSVGMHWGTFRLTDELLDEPPVKLAEALLQAKVSPQRFLVMQHGETRPLSEFFTEDAVTHPTRQAAGR